MFSELTDVEHFYVAASEATEQSFANSGKAVVKHISLAGLLLRLKFSGEAMLPFVLPAISHLLVNAPVKDPDYEIQIWDSVSTHTAFPDAPCKVDDIELRGEIKGFKSSRFESAYFTHARMLMLLDHQSRKGIVCLMEVSAIPAFELACPLRGIFSWILRSNKSVMLHAAAVGTQDGTILIGGNSGAGKSSTALRCLVAGFHYLGDDICAISMDQNSKAKVHSIYCSGKTLSKDLVKFPELAHAVHHHNESSYEKKIFFFNDCFPEKLAGSNDLKVVIIPHQNPELEIGFQEIPFAKALSVISSSTKQLLPDAGHEMFFMLSSVLHQVPCYQFNLGNDPRKIAASLREFLAQLKSSN
ncbi:MAG: hypothetical protein ACKOXB_08515 [Flavobacteriales bacterium]